MSLVVRKSHLAGIDRSRRKRNVAVVVAVLVRDSRCLWPASHLAAPDTAAAAAAAAADGVFAGRPRHLRITNIHSYINLRKPYRRGMIRTTATPR